MEGASLPIVPILCRPKHRLPVATLEPLTASIRRDSPATLHFLPFLTSSLLLPGVKSSYRARGRVGGLSAEDSSAPASPGLIVVRPGEVSDVTLPMEVFAAPLALPALFFSHLRRFLQGLPPGLGCPLLSAVSTNETLWESRRRIPGGA